MDRKRPSSIHSARRRPKAPFQVAMDHCRELTAFMFSNVGITFLVVLYIIAGSILFPWIERGAQKQKMENAEKARQEVAGFLWNITCCQNHMFDFNEFKDAVEKKLHDYQGIIVDNYQKASADSDKKDGWTFAEGFLFSLTVITTIGYGNIAPVTKEGKIATILYAIVGMPLFLLYLSNIGDILAKSFKWIYAKCFLCRICPNIARRRLIREKQKEKLSQQSADETSEDGTTNSGSLSSYEADSDIENEIKQDPQTVTVPIPVCISIMIGYIMLGALLFKSWEGWDLLDSSYFCFISLSSIGFGDLVPGESLKFNATSAKDISIMEMEVSFIFCSIYLLLGMALIAMCFNLMQEQVMHNLGKMKKCASQCFNCKKK